MRDFMVQGREYFCVFIDEKSIVFIEASLEKTFFPTLLFMHICGIQDKCNQL